MGLGRPLGIVLDKPRDLPTPHGIAPSMPLGSALVIPRPRWPWPKGSPITSGRALIECWGLWHAVPTLNFEVFPRLTIQKSYYDVQVDNCHPSSQNFDESGFHLIEWKK